MVEKVTYYGLILTVEDLTPALSSTPTYVLANSLNPHLQDGVEGR